jgi:hypothetical protein
MTSRPRGALRAIAADALQGLRARRRRLALSAASVFAAALVLGVVVTAAYTLDTGFERAADRADFPSVIARFDDEDQATIDARVRRLPNLEARAYRTEVTRVRLSAPGRRLDEGVIHVVESGRRGYALVAGRDVGPGGDEAVIEAGLAREWRLGPGDTIGVGRLGPVRVVGVALSPDNVSYPLTRTARVYLSREGLIRRFGGGEFRVNLALLWATDEQRTEVLLSQARASAGGLRALRFTTRAGVRTLVEQATGLVVGLLVAFALVAAGLAGVLLSAGTRFDVQRRLPAIAVRRSLGAPPGALAPWPCASSRAPTATGCVASSPRWARSRRPWAAPRATAGGYSTRSPHCFGSWRWTVTLVCATSLVQALALAAAERRGAVAALRATGADARALRQLLGGAAAAVVLPAALLAVILEGSSSPLSPSEWPRATRTSRCRPLPGRSCS